MPGLKQPIRSPLSDTSAEAEAVQLRLLREASPARRFGLLRSLTATVVRLSRRGLRESGSIENEGEAACRLAAVVYGTEAPRPKASMDPPDILSALAPAAQALEELRIPYYIGGSVASSVRGVPRSTLDVDVVADIGPEDVAALVEKLQSAYYVDEEAVGNAVRRRSSFNAIHLATMLKVDVFVSKGRDFDHEAQRRATLVALEEGPNPRVFPISSAEDTVLAKLEWYRAGREVSEQQWRDVLGLLKVRAADLDLGYLAHWAAQLGVSDLLQRSLAEAGLVPRRSGDPQPS